MKIAKKEATLVLRLSEDEARALWTTLGQMSSSAFNDTSNALYDDLREFLGEED